MADKDELVRLLAEKYNVSVADVREAVNSQFKFVKEHMETDQMPNIRLPYFGIFKPNKKRLKKILENKKRKQNKSNNNE